MATLRKTFVPIPNFCKSGYWSVNVRMGLATSPDLALATFIDGSTAASAETADRNSTAADLSAFDGKELVVPASAGMPLRKTCLLFPAYASASFRYSFPLEL